MKEFLLLILLLIMACPAARAAGIGDPAPPLTIKMFDGEIFDLATHKGQVVIVNFWASWCPPCQAELPVLGSFYRHHRDQGLAIIEVSLDRPRRRDSARMLLQQYFLPGAMAGDAQANGFGDPESLPTTYIIDAAGVIRAVAHDELTAGDLNDVVMPLLSAKRKSGTGKDL